jgi:hypothetical protein
MRRPGTTFWIDTAADLVLCGLAVGLTREWWPGLGFAALVWLNAIHYFRERQAKVKPKT